MRLALGSLCLITALALSSCGDTTVYQARYMPRSSELTWDEGHEQLPWQPPALGANVETPEQRGTMSENPTFAPETPYNKATETHEYRYRTLAEGGRLP
ncbi:MAG: hypothetical protein ACYTF0_01610 [Planctomycetota bacterium]|jgi:hypothetical protein